jgi:hypothetical protein
MTLSSGLFAQFIPSDLLSTGEIIFHHMAFQRNNLFVDRIDHPFGTREE